MPLPTIYFPNLVLTEQFRARPDPITVDLKCNIYPLSQLGELLSVIKEKPHPINTIRYLVDTSKKIWFAEEGIPNSTIPPHRCMTGAAPGKTVCIAAGNIEFSEDFTEIRMINHKSGDFKPSFDSVKWPLAILVANQELLKTTFSIQLHQDVRVQQLSGGLDLHFFSKDELTAWVNTVLDAAALKELQTQPPEIKPVFYAKSDTKPIELVFGSQRVLWVEDEDSEEEEENKGKPLDFAALHQGYNP